MDGQQDGASVEDQDSGNGGAGGEDERASAFPAGIEAAWGLRSRPHKGPKRGLSLAAIVAAAVAVADAEGIDAVSMSRVAKELGASTMALYRYVTTKDELVTLMVDHALGPPTALPEGIGWRDGLRLWAARTRSAMVAHTWAVPLVAASGPPITPNQLAWLDQALAVLRGTGLSESEKVATALLVSEHVRSEASVMLIMASQTVQDRQWSAYTPFLLRVTEDGRLPALRAAAQAGVFADIDPATAEEDPHDDFGFGLERVLDGIETYMARSVASGRAEESGGSAGAGGERPSG